MITKRYKKGAFFEFLDIRHKLWKIQFSMLIIVASIAFGSTLIQLMKEKCLTYNDQGDLVPKSGDDYSYCNDRVSFINDSLFYLFMGGMFKPIETD